MLCVATQSSTQSKNSDLSKISLSGTILTYDDSAIFEIVLCAVFCATTRSGLRFILRIIYKNNDNIYYAALESVILPNNQFLRWFMLKYGIIDSGRVDNTIT